MGLRSMRRRSWLCAALTYVFVASAVTARAQPEIAPYLSQLVHANEHFGRLLLERLHRDAPQHNVVVSPISLTITFAAIHQGCWNTPCGKEIGDAFGWGPYPYLTVPTRMLLAAFEGPEPPKTVAVPKATLPPAYTATPEEAWIHNAVLFRNKDSKTGVVLAPFADEFVASATKYFGMKFVDTGKYGPTAPDLRAVRKSVGTLPTMSEMNDVWISSGTHLRTGWRGNTFSLGRPFTGEFRTTGGESRKVEMITSELSPYPHAKTDSFEAVVLPCGSASFIAVVPALGKDIHELEAELANSPNALDEALKPEVGVVTMPTFHIISDKNLTPKFQGLGIRRAFKDLGYMMTIPGSHLTEVAQSIDIQVDQSGIRADAETVTGVVYGGIMAGEPFRMKIDRPFLFLIRDRNVNALLFIGAVMDPSRR
jgi:serine protease inhibitor